MQVYVHNIRSARAFELRGQTTADFDMVNIHDNGNGAVSLCLPSGTGRAVADAINAAVQPVAVGVAAE